MRQVELGYGETLDRLVELSINTYYNPYERFQWPESLPAAQWWMSRDLMTVYNTTHLEQLSESQLMRLSKWESINFYSLNIHGIRELIIEVTKRIHSPGYELPSEFFHHILGEENEHMWFFAKFCMKYGSKIYPDISFKAGSQVTDPDIETFLVFARILIFEEIVDYFNVRMGKDSSLHPIIREINSVHHQDESRHVAFGRQIVKQLHAKLVSSNMPEKLLELGTYLKHYISSSIQSLYNPEAYNDAGIPDPYKFRLELLQKPERRAQHKLFLKRTLDFLTKNGILDGEEFLS